MSEHYDDSHNSAETDGQTKTESERERVRTVWLEIKLCCEDTSVATEDLLINNGCNRQTVEAVSEGFPQLYVVSPLACGWQTQQYKIVTILS